MLAALWYYAHLKLFFSYMSVWYVGREVCTYMFSAVPGEGRRDYQTPWVEVMSAYQSPNGGAKNQTGPLEEQHTFLTSEPSL